MNEELINTAVNFLKDSKVSNSPLNKKIEFLEAKGLAQDEIEEALKRANDQQDKLSSTSDAEPRSQDLRYSSYSASQNIPQPIDYYDVAPRIPDRSWKDYFIMATATAGVAYGLYQVINKYLIPSIIPPTQQALDDDKEKIEEEFMKIDKLLEQMSNEQKEMKNANENKLTQIDVVIDNVNDFLSKYNKDKLKFDDDLRLMKLEVDNLKNTVEKNLTETKSDLKENYEEILGELNSLKNLIKLRSTSNSIESGRKIPPVSAIPSASEILKNARANSTPPINKVAEASSQINSDSNSTKENYDQVTDESSENRADAPSVNESKDLLKDDNNSAFTNSSTSPKIDSNEKLVNDTIAKVGVPAWQLNASLS